MIELLLCLHLVQYLGLSTSQLNLNFNNESIGGSYTYNTYAEAQDDIANIREGSTVYIKEGTESDIQ